MWSCFTGFLLVFIAGFFWIGIGVAVSKCSARGWNYNIVQGLTYLGSAMICAVILAGKSVSTGSSGISGFGFLMCSLGGFANFYNYVITAKAMQRGPNGLVWGIMQSGLVGTFLLGVIFFGEKPAPLRLAGLFMIICGVLVMGLAKNKKKIRPNFGGHIKKLGAVLSWGYAAFHGYSMLQHFAFLFSGNG